MTSSRRWLPSPAAVLAFVAICLAFGGGAYAAKLKLKKNAVKTKNIKNGAVTGPKIGAGAVTKDKIAAGVIPASSAAPSTPVAGFAQNTQFSGSSVVAVNTDATVAQLGATLGGGTQQSVSGPLNTTSFSTPNHIILVNYTSDVFGSGAAAAIGCRIQQSVNGGGFADTPTGFNTADGATTAPAGGADDHPMALSTAIKGPKATVDIRVVCNPTFANAAITYNNLSAVAYPSS